MRAVALLLLLALCATPAAQGVPSLIDRPLIDRPLIDAVKRGDHAAVRTLLRNKTLINQPEPDGTTALHHAVLADDTQMVSMLIAAGANVKPANRYGLRPLTLAATNGSEPTIAQLLRAGADPNTVTDGGEPVISSTAVHANAASSTRLRSINCCATTPPAAPKAAIASGRS